MTVLSPGDKRQALANMADLPEGYRMRHILQLDSDYYQEFDLPSIREHVQLMAQVSDDAPFQLKVEAFGEKSCGLTLIGLDYPGLLAGLTGLLTGLGYDIRSARVFTCTRRPNDGTPADHVVDFLVLEHADLAFCEDIAQAELHSRLSQLYSRLATRDTAGLRTDIISKRIARLDPANSPDPHALPLEIHFESLPKCTKMIIRGPDHQGMLFCLSLGISLQNIVILKMLSASEQAGISDQFLLVGPQGKPLRHPEETEPLRVALLLMERFVSALSAASDIPAALLGLNRMLETWLPSATALAEGEAMDAQFLPALARVLSHGPHLWDQVLSLGPTGFKTLLDEGMGETAPSRATYAQRLVKTLLQSEGEPFPTLVAWRHREVLKIEIGFLLDPESRIEPMSAALTSLAEACLEAALDLLLNEMRVKHGNPGAYGLFALGKFGGQELGAGSDLEILLLHEDSETLAQPPEATGEEPLRQGTFFSQVAMRLQQLWQAPQGSTFALDWRLRPHGDSGPMAAHAEAWRQYLSPNGGALDYEVQAHLRLRPLVGDAGFLQSCMQWRDDLVFRNPPVGLEHTLHLREQQIQVKTKPDSFNVKFSPGGMVDIEYAVQFLQLQYGRQHPHLRQASTTMALEALLEVGVLSLAEFERSYNAFLFLRRLQGHLRLNRGMAKDLTVPRLGTPEQHHLALKMGYALRSGHKPDNQLDWDIRSIRQSVSGFFDYRFRGAAKPDFLYTSLAQNLMDPICPLEECEPALRRMGMTDLPRARHLFLDLFSLVVEKRLLAAALLLAEERLLKSPDPEFVLRQLVRYFAAQPYPDVTVKQMLHHPPLLHGLLTLFGHSVYLGDVLVRESNWLKEVLRPGILEEALNAAALEKDLAAFIQAQNPLAKGDEVKNREALAEQLCRFRDHEYLRIALRDVHLNHHLQRITRDISLLSDALIRAAVQTVFAPWQKRFPQTDWALIAMGKLGGQELNYSSDIDLIALRDGQGMASDPSDDSAEAQSLFDACARDLIQLLSSLTAAGRVFRVDMNLRPWGRQGYLTGTEAQYLRYYREEAQGWELQAWLKARTVAGQGSLGPAFIASVQSVALHPDRRADIEASMIKVRHMALQQLQQQRRLAGEVKLGPGGIRTVEFFTQALQIRHGHDLPEILGGNTLEALGRLQRYRILTPSQHQTLASAYVFLRRVEHRLQLLAMQQHHDMPSDPVEMEKLARRMGYDARFGQPATLPFLDHYRKHMLTLLHVSGQLFDH